MTVSSIIPVNNYTGNSYTTTFDFDFLIEAEKELIVTHIDSNGISKILKEGVDYSINEIGNKNGSYITFPLSGSTYSVLGTDEKISLSLTLDIKQESEFRNSSYFNFDILEWTFDYIVRILQILNRKIDRSVKVSEGSETTPDALISELNNAKETAVLSAQSAESAKQTCSSYLTQTQQNITYFENLVDSFSDTYEECLQDILDEGIETRANVDLSNLSSEGEKRFLNKTRITNCVLEIPFNLKIEEIEAENYTITLKSGSKAALPDGTLYTFTQDNNINVTNGALLFYNPGTSGFGATSIDNCFSGASEPISATTNAFWFDTANMRIKRKTSSGDWTTGWTMPLCHNNGEEIKVFNGFGYVGATQFILPGVKFLIPNGRNADGTLNNTVYTTGNVVFQTYTYYAPGRNQGVIFRSTGGLIRYSEYYESDIEPEPVSSCAWLDTKNNQMKYCLSAGNGWEVMPGAVFAEEVVNNTSYQIQSIRFKKPVELVKKEEMDIIFKSPKVQSYDIIQYGSPTLSNNILSNFSQTNYVRANTLFYPDTTTWEMNFLITTGSDVSSIQTFCSSDYNILEIGISNDKHFFIEINGGSWVKGTYTVLADTTYYVKVKYTGTQYILSYSLNGSSYTPDITYDMTTPLNLENRNPFIYYGKDYNNNNEIFSGTIDLTGCNIIVDDYLIWQGVRDYNNTEYPTKNRPAVVVQAFVNGTSGYRVWSDRYCEQWGYAESVNKSAIITLPLAMSNGNYNIICTGTEAQGGGDNGSMNAYNVSATGFSIYNTSDVVSNAYWRVFGYRK